MPTIHLHCLYVKYGRAMQCGNVVQYNEVQRNVVQNSTVQHIVVPVQCAVTNLKKKKKQPTMKFSVVNYAVNFRPVDGSAVQFCTIKGN